MTSREDWRSYYDQGEQALKRQRPADAEASFRKALNLAKKVSPNSDDSIKCQMSLADTLTLRNMPAEAIQIYQELLSILTKKYGSNSKEVVPVLFSLGSIQEALGDHTSAIAYYQRALRINEKSYGNYSPAFAENLQALGRANAKAGKKQEAAKNYKQAMSILMDEPSLNASGRLESLMHDYSDLIQKDDDSDQSLIKDFKEDILHQGSTTPSGQGTTGNGSSPLLNMDPSRPTGDPVAFTAPLTTAGIASAWQVQSSLDQRALQQEQTNEDSRVQLRGLTQPWSDKSLSPAYRVVRNSIVDRNRYAHGEDYYQRMIAVDINTLGPHHPSVANDLSGLAQFYLDRHDYAKAQPLLSRAYEIYLDTYGMDNLLTINSLASLARVEFNLGNTDKAIELYRTALTHCQSTFGSGHLETARILNELAYLYFHLGNLQESQKLYGLALASTEASVGKSSPWLAACLKDYAQVLRSVGQTKEAQSLENRATGILDSRSDL
jgi:tetratricopeptide (TPR) repeat protein